DIASKYEVKAMPTFLLIKEGVVVGRLVGANPEETKKRIETHLQSNTQRVAVCSRSWMSRSPHTTQSFLIAPPPHDSVVNELREKSWKIRSLRVTIHLLMNGGDYGVADDDYEGPQIFDDDQYEEEIVSGDVGV
nr:thioredoxin-like protein CXXS1 [Tanacetum cinerariifolium]